MRLAVTLNQTNPPMLALESGLRLVAEQVNASMGWFLSLSRADEVEVVARYRSESLSAIFPEGQRVFGMCRCLHRMLVSQDESLRAHVVECERLARVHENPGDLRYHLSIPVQSGGRPVGMINLVLAEGKRIPEPEMRFLESLGNQFGGALERARLFAETQQALERERRLNEAARAIAEAFDQGAICMLSQERAGLDHVAQHNFRIDLNTFGRSIPGGQSICLQVMESGMSLLIGPDGLSGYLVNEMHSAGVRQLILVPIPMNSLMEGVLVIASQNIESYFDQRELFLVQTLAEQAGVALLKVRLYEEVKRLATIDGLTGLVNRAHFYEIANAELSRVQRYSHSLSVFMVDVDHFKQINDTFGHAVGDQVLQEIARIMKASMRQVDIIGRLGGEEIAVMMPETGLQAALLAAERMRQAIERVDYDTPRGKASATVSIGVVCQKGPDAIDLEELLVRADQALYVAKNEGRNRVVAWKAGLASQKLDA